MSGLDEPHMEQMSTGVACLDKQTMHVHFGSWGDDDEDLFARLGLFALDWRLLLVVFDETTSM